MAGMGPPPKPDGSRRRTNATVAMTKLPAEGRQGDAPEWPLGSDVVAQAKLDRLDEQIDGLSLDAQGTTREAKAAQRKLSTLQERAEALTAEIDAIAERELKLWADLWRTPQAVAWERLGWTYAVAEYARWAVRGQLGDLDAAKEARQLSDRLGLSPLAMLRLRWEIVQDEVADQRSTRGAKSAAGSARSRAARRGIKAVDTG